MKYSESEILSFYDKALKARDHSYSPYSRHPVGGVLIDDQGQIYSGCNVEVAHFKGICAEGTLITQMILNGGPERKIRDVFLMGPDLSIVCPPCGDCRQRIREFSDDKTRIYCFGEGGVILKTFTLDELLPYSFGPENVPAYTDKK